MLETWLVTEAGVAVHPSETWVDEAGRLMHASGPIAMRDADTPRSRSVDPAAERPPVVTAEAKPERPKRGYKTRGA